MKIRFVKNNPILQKIYMAEVFAALISFEPSQPLLEKGLVHFLLGRQTEPVRSELSENGLLRDCGTWKLAIDYSFIVFLMVHLWPEQDCSTSKWPKSRLAGTTSRQRPVARFMNDSFCRAGAETVSQLDDDKCLSRQTLLDRSVSFNSPKPLILLF